MSFLRFMSVPPGLLRLLLALVVVVHHGSRLALGAWAVNVFFMMSGYWVTMMYRAKYSRALNPLTTFYASRYLRLVPLLFVCQVCMAGLLFWAHDPAIRIMGPSWIARCFLLIGSAGQKVLLVPSWSLDVEAQFYLCLPLLIWLLDRYSERTAALIAISAAALLAPLTLLIHGRKTPYLPLYAAFFLIGAANAYRPLRLSVEAGTAWITGFAATLICLLSTSFGRGLFLGGVHPYNLSHFQYNDQACALLALLFAPALCFSLALRSSPTDKHLGNLAYPVYLFHWLPHYAITSGALILLSPLRARLLDVALVLVGSVALYFLVDVPCEAWRRALVARISGRRRPAPEPFNEATDTCSPTTAALS